HVLMLSKQQEPTNREAFTLIIGPKPYKADMQTVKRRCAQTAHISLQLQTFQRARTQNAQHTRTSGVSAVMPPEFLSRRFTAASNPSDPRFRAPSVSVSRCLGPLARTRKRKKHRT
ncbi:MAG: hypothetical protein ACRC14_10000, partial [Paracoccaceae bacterium]